MSTLTQEQRLALLTRMLRMRRFEETVIHLALAHSYVGRQHLHIGHETTGAAVGAVMKPGDKIHTTHRNHGFVIAAGAEPGKAFAEILGRADGLNGGKGGTWHLCDLKHGISSTSAMVGGSIALAIGSAWAMKCQKTDNVAFAHFGDGTLDEGIAYESLNMASIFELPVVFLCENNSKAGQRPSSMLAAKALRHVPEALSIPSVLVNGADAEETLAAIAEATKTVRSGKGPVFLEVTLERWPGSHQVTAAFPTGVTDLEMAWDESRISGKHGDWIKRFDPLRLYVKKLAESKAMTRQEILDLDRRVQADMADARRFAEASPYPKVETAFQGVFA
ncbi:MAG: thiamine pyrophosphate-dependent dehydrogenase E1 component subunit alpha [Gemmatimonas sp.]